MAKTQKVKEVRQTGFGGSHTQVRVRELAPEEGVPAGAFTVPDDTPVSEWQDLEEGE